MKSFTFCLLVAVFLGVVQGALSDCTGPNEAIFEANPCLNQCLKKVDCPQYERVGCYCKAGYCRASDGRCIVDGSSG